MTPIAMERSSRQLLGRPATNVLAAVEHLGALQAQDYPGALWAVGLRSGATRREVEQAIVDRRIVRTWPMRGTLHFVPARDVRWMIALDCERRMRAAAGRHRQLALTADDFREAERAAVRALEQDAVLTRPELLASIGRAVSTEGQRGAHLLIWLSLHGVVCFGPHRGKTPTFVLLDRWVPEARVLPRDEAITILARRYFVSHAPTTIGDFAWWSGRTLAEARRAHDAVRSILVERDGLWAPRDAAPPGPAPRLHLLPGFDEMLLGYRDRSATLDGKHARVVSPGNGVFRASVLDRGRVVGTWSRTATAVKITPFARLPSAERARAVAAHAAFLELPLVESRSVA